MRHWRHLLLIRLPIHRNVKALIHVLLLLLLLLLLLEMLCMLPLLVSQPYVHTVAEAHTLEHLANVASNFYPRLLLLLLLLLQRHALHLLSELLGHLSLCLGMLSLPVHLLLHFRHALKV
jgi:hypothetical protein